MENKTFLNTLDAGKIDTRTRETEANMEYFTNITDVLVSNYTSSLDCLMVRINDEAVVTDATDYQLEKFILELSGELYALGSKLEAMGIKDDLSKLAAKEVYNATYLDSMNGANKKPTVAELTAIAEDSARYETIMNNIYSRAYRQIKYKVDASYEMLATLRKVISKRMQDSQLAMQRATTVGNEEF